MTTYMARSAWTSTNAAGSTLTGSGLVGVAVHWPGTTTSSFGVESVAKVAERLRGWRNFHVNGRGWSDIGYNLAIDQAGRVWMCRSTTFAVNRVGAHSASSSNPNANRHRVGVLFILGANEQPSAAMIEAFRHWRHTVFMSHWGSNKTDLRGHGQVPGASTSCPGTRTLGLINNGTLARPPGSSSSGPEGSTGSEVNMFPRRGDTSEAVQFWQRVLHTLGYYPGGFETSTYGPSTQAAVAASRADLGTSTTNPDVERITPWNAMALLRAMSRKYGQEEGVSEQNVVDGLKKAMESAAGRGSPYGRQLGDAVRSVVQSREIHQAAAEAKASAEQAAALAQAILGAVGDSDFAEVLQQIQDNHDETLARLEEHRVDAEEIVQQLLPELSEAVRDELADATGVDEDEVAARLVHRIGQLFASSGSE